MCGWVYSFGCVFRGVLVFVRVRFQVWLFVWVRVACVKKNCLELWFFLFTRFQADLSYNVWACVQEMWVSVVMTVCVEG